jgi:hemerythrin-like metal-binding protein
MTKLTWQPEFALQQPHMDRTHLEFVELLAATEAAAPGEPTDTALRELLAHAEAHFAQEEDWMERLGYARDNCHFSQHEGVLQVLREVARRHRQAADAALVAYLVAALAQWFEMHAPTADAALAMAMAEHGFDPETGAMHREPEPATTSATGRRSARCG